MKQTEVRQEQSTSPVQPAQKKPRGGIPRRRSKWPKRVIYLAVAAALAAVFFLWRSASPRQAANLGYIPATAAVGDLTVAVTGTGTVQPIDSYKVTALVKGEVLEAPFEEGDTVEKDDLLFRIEAKAVETSIQQAQLSVEQAQLNYNETVKSKGNALKNVDIKANAAGVVQKLYYKAGDMVAAGSPVADILDRENLILTVPFHAADAAGISVGQTARIYVDGTYETLTGTVDAVAVSDQTGAGGTLVREVKIKVRNPGALGSASTGTASVGAADCAAGGPFAYAAQKTVLAAAGGELASLAVKEGDRVTDGQVLGAFKGADMDAQVAGARIGLQNAQLALENAQNQLENYTITSPISGTVIEKNYKAGDNIDATSAGAGYMAIIYDMSTLTFNMSINELDMGKIRVGQEVEITAAALEGQTFTGRVDKININGTTVGGFTSYPVTVVIDDAKNLLPGMNVSAKIVVERAQNVLTVPVEAVTRGGEGGEVTVALPGALNAEGTAVADPTKLEQRAVKLGRGDSASIEITEGLQAGDVVVYKSVGSNAMASMMVRGG